MTNTNLLQAMGRIDPKLIADAALDVSQKKAINRVWPKWGVIAACLYLVIAGIFATLNRFDNPNETIPQTLAEQLSEYGLSAENVLAPAFTLGGKEMPQVTKEDLLAIVQSNITVRGKIQSSSYTQVTSGNEHWYFAQLTLEVTEVISGEMKESSVTIISACCYVDVEEEAQGLFPVDEVILECRDGMEGVFVLRSVDSDATWNIGGVNVAPQSLGDYLLTLKLDMEDGAYIYHGITVTPDEVLK